MEDKKTLTVYDLAHFFGCRCRRTDLVTGHLEDVEIDTSLLRLKLTLEDELVVKPILRPRSDMTDEERKHEESLYREYPVTPVHRLTCQSQTPESIAYVMRLGIDVFGWIGKGLAIDKTKLDKS